MTKIYAIEQAVIEHHGVRGMKWGLKRFNSKLNKASKLAKSADQAQSASNAVEGTKGSQIRRALSRPIQSRATRLAGQSDRVAQVAYLKASSKLSKIRKRSSDPAKLEKINNLHKELQSTLSKQEAIRKTTKSKVSEHQMRQLNDIYGKYSKGAKISTALGGLDADTKSKIKRLSDAVDIATAVAPIGKASKAMVSIKPKADKILTAAGKIAEGKSPLPEPNKKAIAIKAGRLVTNRDGARTNAVSQLKGRIDFVKKKKKKKS